MKNLQFLFFFLFASVTACDDEPIGTSVVPTDLEVKASVSTNGTGQVTVNATAVNALHYSFDFGDDSEETMNQTGTTTYSYSESGSYQIEVRAFGNTEDFIFEIVDVTVQVTRDLGTPPTTGYSTPESYDGFTLVWSDEFDGTSLNSSNWTHEIGNGTNGWGNNELQYYREENSIVSDGALTIEARSEAFGGRDYTSSRIITQGKQEFQYGRIDIRASLPFGQGVWPALWMLGANFPTIGWPRSGEIDIMELVGHKPDEVFGTLHWDENGTKADFGNINDPYRLSNGTFADEWHVFSIEWTANSIIWYVDDVQHHSVNISGEMEEFKEPFFFIFNIAVGGNLPGNPNSSTTFPQRMYVDYVRVFQPN